MAIYDFAMASWMELTGVDTAMCYRAEMLSEKGYDIKLVFPRSPDIRDLKVFKDKGFECAQFLSVPVSFSDAGSLEPVKDLEQELEHLKDVLYYTEIQEMEESLLIKKDGNIVAEILLTKEKNRFYGIQYFVEGHIVRRDYYSDILYASIIYEPVKRDGIYLAIKKKAFFYNRDGSVALTQVIHNDQIYYILADGRCLNQGQLFNLFVKNLGLTKDDFVIIDRPSTEFSPKALYEYSDRTNIVSVFHAEQFFEKGLSVTGENLNREYWYWFKYSNHIRTMVVSTEEQKNSLIDTLQHYGSEVPDIRVIPVIGLEELNYPLTERKPKSVACVSRLNVRKKIDWTIYTAIKAHEMDNEITLDIYGTGDQSYIEYLEHLIEENGASDYIKLKGHVANVMDVYRNYEVFLTTSLWETFGITLLEAVGSGLALVGLDVKYGNRLFIQDGYNGYLVPYNPEHFDEKCPSEVEMLAERIIEILSDTGKLNEFSRHSYAIAKQYMTDRIKNKWYELVEEL